MRLRWAVVALTTALATSGVAAASADVPAGMKTLGETVANGVDAVMEQGDSPLPPPKGPWPKSGTLSVFLCSKNSTMPSCHGRATTAEQKRRLEKLLKRLPGVSRVRFVNQDESFRKFREEFRHNTSLIAATLKSDMPESFEAKVKVVNAKQANRLAKLPGVASAHEWRTDFWLGKAHAQVRLCAPRNDQGACQGRGQTTDLERDAIFEALRNLEGVKKIYLEPREHAVRNWRNIFADSIFNSKTIASVTGESFHLVLADPSNLTPINAALKELSGVEKVLRHR
ncbi:permease-like cell division protein FtsX [Nonomuraea guangzhouensis]|uniref:Permease-like cell division protein FtsX n=1 Tax=Nonomuraea guangzhouensis TaxID=1291555 RepID=A0ABW4G0I9_9ACTN|nr:permease-like cell division protein FtsX [Nonomuraea guangzhouensis]